MEEVWKDIPDYEGMYQVSSCGNVRSLTRPCTWREGVHGFRKGRPVCLLKHKLGYRHVILSKCGVKCKWLVHRLVMHTFVGPCPDGMVVCHNDGDPSNNHLSNLRYDTHAGNHRDKELHGTWQGGEANGNSKLTAESVREIKRQRRDGCTLIAIAKQFDVSQSTIHCIANGHIWRHVA